MKAWLELLRVANWPTVVSNMVMAVTIAYSVAAPFPVGVNQVLDQAFLLIVAACLMYGGGVVLNDALDVRIDATQRQHRPIPSGRLTLRTASTASVLMLAVGVSMTLVYRPPVTVTALLLVVLIVFYNTVHQRVAWSVWVMAACRGVLVLMGLVAVMKPAEVWGPLLIAPAVVAGYVLILSRIARHEVQRSREGTVTWLIAGMPLVDAALCLGWGRLDAAVVCVGLGVLTVVMQRVLPGA